MIATPKARPAEMANLRNPIALPLRSPRRRCCRDTRLRGYEIHLIMLKSGRGEAATEIGAGVQPDATTIPVRFLLRSMPVNDNCLERTAVRQELFPYPEEIL